MMERKKVIIIGAGITGLYAAHQLLKSYPAAEVVVLESSSRCGGLVRTDTIDGFRCDWGPNGFLDKEPLMLEWVAELGLSDSLVHANEAAANRYLCLDGRLVKLKGPPAFFLSPALSLRGKLRLLKEPFVPPKANDDPESVWAFAARRLGAEAADNLISAMVLGIFGGDANELSMRHCFPRLTELEAEHGSLVKALFASRGRNGGGPMGPRGVLTSFQGGIETLVDTASKKLGADVRTEWTVERIERTKKGWTLTSADGTHIGADAIVVATPAYTAAQLLHAVDQDLGEALAAIPYAPIVVVCTGYRNVQFDRELDGFGFLVPPNQGRRVLGTIWTSSVFPDTAPEEHSLLRTMLGGPNDSDVGALSDEDLLAIIQDEVHPLLDISGAPVFRQVFRHPRAIPQYGLNHGELLDRIERGTARTPGLYIAGNAYRGVGLNDCVVSADRAVSALRDHLKPLAERAV